jgi:hypothetical protein
MGLEGTLSAALTGSQTVELTIGTHQVTAHVSGTHWYYQPTVAPSWFVDDTYTVTARVVDGASSGTAFTKPLVLDTKAPHITSATQNFTQDVNQALVITFDEPVSWHGIVDPESDYEQWHDADNFVKLVHNGLTEWVYIDNRNLSNGGRTLTISANDLHLASGKDYTAGNYIDYNKFTFTTTGTSSDTVAPKALAAYAMQTGTFGIGEQIEIKVKFSEPVTGGAVWPELNLSNGGKATFQFPSNDGRTMDFRYTVAAGDATGYLDLDGLGTMLENVIDIAGNKLAPGSLHLSTLLDPGLGSMVFIDTTVPATIATAPVLDDASDAGLKGDSVTNANFPSFHGVGATSGTTVVLYDISWDGQEAIGHATARTDGSWSISLDRELPLINGEHHLAVGQLSTYGNPSHALSPELTLTIDRTADSIEPEIDVDSDGGVIRDWKTAVTSPTLVLRYVETGATVTILDGETPLTVTSTIDSTGLWHVKLPTLSNGTHSLKITQTDVTGNTSPVVSRELVIDPAEVLVPVPQPPAKLALPRLDTDTGFSGTDGITSASQPVFKGSGALPHATIQLTDGKFILLSGQADGDGAWTLSPSTALSDGAYMFTVRQIDSGSLIGPSSDPLSVTIDTAAPSKLDAPILKAADDSGSSPSDLITNVTKPGFSGTGEAGATVELWDGSTKLVSKTVDSSGTWSLSPATALAEGVHSLTLKQVDAAGNASTSDATSITIDTTAPAKLNAPLLAASSDSGSSSSDLLTNVKMPEFKGTGAVANATMELREGNNVLATGTARSDGTWSLTVSEGKALADGVHAISVLQFDAAGNSSTSDATSITIDTLAPTVTGWTPTVKLGHNFELWFSERVDHSALSSYADVSISPSLFHYSLADSAYWIDNAVRDDHTTSVFGFTPTNTGWLQLTLSGVKDLAGNEAVIPLAHYEFTVDLSGTSFFVPSPLL